MEYTRETLVSFKKEMEDKAAAAKKGGQDGGGFGGFGGFGGGDKKAVSKHNCLTLSQKSPGFYVSAVKVF